MLCQAQFLDIEKGDISIADVSLIDLVQPVFWIESCTCACVILSVYKSIVLRRQRQNYGGGGPDMAELFEHTVHTVCMPDGRSIERERRGIRRILAVKNSFCCRSAADVDIHSNIFK